MFCKKVCIYVHTLSGFTATYMYVYTYICIYTYMHIHKAGHTLSATCTQNPLPKERTYIT